MNILQDVITYVRRLIKSPSDAVITDNLIIDYINRFCVNDIPAIMQLFDFKKKYQFQTRPGFDQYNMPLYGIQTEPGNQNINYYPVYQGFLAPCYINGVSIPFFTEKQWFYNTFQNVVQPLTQVALGNGGTNYSFQLPIAPNNNSTPLNIPINYLLRGNVDISGVLSNADATGILQDPIFGTTIQETINTTSIFPAVYITSLDANGNSVVVSDSGQFLQIETSNYPQYGLLMNPGGYPTGNTPLNNGYSQSLNTINYFTGAVNVTFPVSIPSGTIISAQCYYFQSGLPRAVLFNDNILTFRSVPDRQYLVEIDGYLSPAAYLSTLSTILFGYMSEFISLGAARKLLSDTGDFEQLNFYESRYIEQRDLVWKRSARQFASTRTQTLYSQNNNQAQFGSYSGGWQS